MNEWVIKNGELFCSDCGVRILSLGIGNINVTVKMANAWHYCPVCGKPKELKQEGKE